MHAVHEPHLNHAYLDPTVCLLERPDPDAGKKKRVHGPEELESLRSISAVSLRVLGAEGAGPSGQAAGDVAGPALKKVSRGPKVPEVASSASSSSAESVAVVAEAGAMEAVASSFGIASRALEEVSAGTPSQVHGRGTEDTLVDECVDAPAAIR